MTVEEEVQVRYRTETRTDSEGNTYTVEVPYNYYILHVDLENFNLSHVPVYIMGEEQLSLYAVYMSSLGNRPDLFPQSGYVSKYYENPPADYEVPAALLGSDEKFARLMEEADKYVGFPYVWGGSTPETSFDCSGFVSYVLTNSGLYNTGRLGAQGLYNISTPVSNPQPGDLVFFTGTYDTPGVSHVGIYVGEDGDGSPVMQHCGDPIQYSKLDKMCIRDRIATIRSREMSASIILQSQSQLKAIYKDAAEIILDNEMCIRDRSRHSLHRNSTSWSVWRTERSI